MLVHTEIIGILGNVFSYQIIPNPLISVCTNNGSLPYETQSTLVIHPTPVMDPNTFINNPPVPASVPQGTSTTLTIDMLVGTPPFNIIVNGNETPIASSSNFNILGMSGTGILTPNYDINTNPVTISVDQITDNNGCSFNNNPVSVSITNPSSLTIANTSTVNVSCIGGNNGRANVTVSGGTQPYSYLWSNGQTSATATSLTAGSYSCTITDANGCVVTTQNLNVFQPSAISLNFSSVSNVSCLGGSNGFATISVTGGTSPYSYLWSNGEESELIQLSTPGSYSVQVTDFNGCQKDVSFTIDPISALNIAFVTQGVTCADNIDGSAEVIVSGGYPPYRFLWDNNIETPLNEGLSSGNIGLTVTDNNGCSIFQEANVPSSNKVCIK